MAMALVCRNLLNAQARQYCTNAIARRLEFAQHGDPLSVLSMQETTLTSYVKPSEVLVEMLMAPVNPANLNVIQGVYPVKTHLPAVGGSEGVGRVVKVNSDCKHLAEGDWVIVAGSGTWSSLTVANERSLFKIAPNSVDLPSAATISVNPSTAYRLLKDYVDLKPGDVVVQNGANSAVGQAIIQLCRIFGFKTVNILRNRAGVEETAKYLSSLGADIVLTEEELKGVNGKALMKDIPAPKLGLNCVGGKNSLYLATSLAEGSKMVTYGGMSKLPVQVPTAQFIFKDISLHGFWMTNWYDYNDGTSKKAEMLEFLLKVIREGKLKPPIHELVNFATDWRKAVEVACSGSGPKQILVFDKTAEFLRSMM